MTTRILITGGAGFIGAHLVKYLVERDYWVRAVDIKDPEYEPTAAHEFRLLDMRDPFDCHEAMRGIEEVYALAADMGGIGYIENHKAQIVTNSALANLNTIEAAHANGVKRYFLSSSACVYSADKQRDPNGPPLKEEDAFPSLPEPGYGEEKLFAERVCEYFREDYGLETRVARFHNCFGPKGSYDGGREKSPAAICRKIALCNDGDEIEVWGDGQQTRSYMYIDDCVEGIYRLMQSDHHEPLNLGQDRMISINDLVDMVAKIAGKKIGKRYDLTKPQGVRGRSSDNTRLRQVLNWEPQISLEEGLKRTYEWIAEQVAQKAETLA